VSYRVYQDGIRCSEYTIGTCDLDTFETKREAEVFAFYWAYDVSYETSALNAPSMVIGEEVDYGMSPVDNVFMKIEEV